MGNNTKGSSEYAVMLFVGIALVTAIGFSSILGTLIWNATAGNHIKLKLQRIESNQHQIILLLSRKYPDYEKIHAVKKRKHKKEKNK